MRFNYPDIFAKANDYTFYSVTSNESLVELDPNRSLWSYPDFEIKLLRKLRGLKVVIFGQESSGAFEVSFYDPLSEVIKPILKFFNLEHINLQHIILQKPGDGGKLSLDMSLAGQNFAYDATIQIKLHEAALTVEEEKQETRKEDSVNIWDEPDDEKYIRYAESKSGNTVKSNISVEAATLNKLVEKLTSLNTSNLSSFFGVHFIYSHSHFSGTVKNDQEFVSIFFTTFASFTSPEILLQKIMERYNVPLGRTFSKDEISNIQLGCQEVIYLLLTKCYHNLTKKFENTLTEFVDNYITEGMMAKKIRMAILNRVCFPKMKNIKLFFHLLKNDY